MSPSMVSPDEGEYAGTAREAIQPAVWPCATPAPARLQPSDDAIRQSFHLTKRCGDSNKNLEVLREMLATPIDKLGECQPSCRRIVDSIADFSFSVLADDNCAAGLRHAAGFHAVTGYSEVEFAADPKLWLRMIAETERATVLDQARQALKEGSAPAIEHRIVRKDGTTRWVLRTVIPREGQPGSPRVYDVVAQDVSKQSLGPKRDQEEWLRIVAELTQEAVYVRDLRVGTVRWQGIVHSETGLAVEDLRNGGIDQWLESIHPEDRSKTWETWNDTIRTSRNYRFGYRLRRHDGRHVEVEDHGMLVKDSEGKPGYLVGSICGISKRQWGEADCQRLETHLRQAQKMECVGRLAGGVAHDFNNVLTTIFAYMDLVLSRMDEAEPSFRMLSEARKAADRAASLTRQLLTLSRRQATEPAVIDLNEMVEEMHRMLTRVLGDDIEVRKDLAKSLGRVLSDKGQIEQILVNLCINARDAMPDGGAICIATGNVRLDVPRTEPHFEAPAGNYVTLSVSDTGSGMSEEVKSHLFEPFFTTKAPGKGTGLGLASVYGAVRQNGGFIDVQSEEGQGTTFTIHLPRTQSPGKARPLGSLLSSIPMGRETILFVEDDSSVRSSTEAILQRLGYQVLSCPDPAEAIRTSEAYRDTIHLLLTDVVMPGTNGPVLAGTLAALRPGIKVIFISGYTLDVISHHGILPTDSYFLPKPFLARQLAAKIREALDESGAGTDAAPAG